MEKRKEERKIFTPICDIDTGYCEHKGNICPLVYHGWRGYIYCPLHICESCMCYIDALKQAKEYDDID